MCCPLVFEFSVGIGGFVIGLGQISFFFSSDTWYMYIVRFIHCNSSICMIYNKHNVQNKTKRLSVEITVT